MFSWPERSILGLSIVYPNPLFLHSSTFSGPKRLILALSIVYPNLFFVQTLSKLYFELDLEIDPCFIHCLSKSTLCPNFMQFIHSVDPSDWSLIYPLFIQIHPLSLFSYAVGWWPYWYCRGVWSQSWILIGVSHESSNQIWPPLQICPWIKQGAVSWDNWK